MIQILQWRLDFLALIESKKEVVAPAFYKYVASTTPTNEAEADAMHAACLKFMSRYEAVNVSVGGVRGLKVRPYQSLKGLGDTLRAMSPFQPSEEREV